MQVINGRKYYRQNEFEVVVMQQLEIKADDLGVTNPVESFDILPVQDQNGAQLGMRIYLYGDMPVLSTAINENGFYLITKTK